MLMTRCPHCGTAFRVKPEQLRARGGRVRCGHCQAPFSALESLIDSPPADLAPQTDPAPATQLAGSASKQEPAAPAAPEPASVVPPPAQAPALTPAQPDAPAPRTPFAVQSAMAGHRTSTWNMRTTSELAPPIPELDPAATNKPSYSLDFDLDADELPAPAVQPPQPISPSTSDFVRPARSDEQTALTFDWRMAGDIPGGHGGGPAPHEAEVDLTASDWHGAPQEVRPTHQEIEEPLETEELASDPDPREPVFVTAYASPAGVSREPIWAAPDAPVEPFEDDRFSPLPEQVAASSAVVGRETESAPDEPELIEHETEAFEAAAPAPIAEEVHEFAWEKSHEPARWPWGLAVAALLLTTAAQGLLWSRHDIAREFPATRRLFEAACAQIGCSMPWPRLSAQISIDASDLHPRGERDGQFELSGTLHNKAGFDQAYPHLEVTLTDVFNRALVRRALPPEVWLPPNLKGTSAFAAGADIAFTIYLDAGNQSATGYKLYAFYP